MPTRKKTSISKRSSTRHVLRTDSTEDGSLNFSALVEAIRRAHEQSAAIVNRTVNTTLTLRNWVIGGYIREYEQRGADRAKYGDELLVRLAERLKENRHQRIDERELRRYRTFYVTYPMIRETLSPEFTFELPFLPIQETVSPEKPARICQLVSARSEENSDMQIQNTGISALAIPAEKLINSLSFSHFAELIAIEDPLKRAFYEIECIRGNWSVRALKRQIATLYFERSGLSKDKEKLAAMVQKGVESAEPKLAIRDPYIFEFLGLRAKDAVSETDLETALVENLREFLLELGHGFCLEAQQKCILIGKTRGFVDLVFYHRILKCHVLVELKVDEFTHEHVGQLNTYVTWYREHMMSAGDNPPIGLLLCTGKDHTLVEYATASMDNHLFVSKYAIELPSKAELEKFLHARHLEMLGGDCLA
ncbi:MAG: PDDEXK nuclease domain-containing protein [Verrucomicrobiota bacterium]|nr:PDDEXK nuclease domain-containing protein [Verrucomicrobiota bacterium]